MEHVSSKDINRWGSYKDRQNSFDDVDDLVAFAEMCVSNPKLNEYIKSYFPEPGLSITPKPDGDKGVDLGIVNSGKEIIGTVDVERWSAWDSEWPSFYKWIHFLGRKDKFLRASDQPFFMAYLNYSQNKVLIVDKDTLLQFPTKEKLFQAKGVVDKVKEIPMYLGRIFGEHLTEMEQSLFNTGEKIGSIAPEAMFAENYQNAFRPESIVKITA